MDKEANHEDDGKGYDPYHGRKTSREIGGIGVQVGEETSCFQKFHLNRIVSTGSLRMFLS